jgi:hypothetical protein
MDRVSPERTVKGILLASTSGSVTTDPGTSTRAEEVSPLGSVTV